MGALGEIGVVLTPLGKTRLEDGNHRASEGWLGLALGLPSLEKGLAGACECRGSVLGTAVHLVRFPASRPGYRWCGSGGNILEMGFFRR